MKRVPASLIGRLTRAVRTACAVAHELAQRLRWGVREDPAALLEPRFRLVLRALKRPRIDPTVEALVHQSQGETLESRLEAIREAVERNRVHRFGLPWRLPGAALLTQDVDCKALSVVVAEAAKALHARAELWFGYLPSVGMGHIWVEVEQDGERLAVDLRLPVTSVARHRAQLAPTAALRIA